MVYKIYSNITQEKLLRKALEKDLVNKKFTQCQFYSRTFQINVFKIPDNNYIEISSLIELIPVLIHPKY